MSRIREVWAPNLEAEMNNIRDLIDKYPYIAMVSSLPHSFCRPTTTYVDARIRSFLASSLVQ